MDKAARHIIDGAAFDNNLLCIGEKQVFVTDSAYSTFISAFEKAGAVKLNTGELAKLSSEVFTTTKDAGGCSHAVLNRELVGADASVLANAAGKQIDPSVQLLYAETDLSHPFVMEEQMMPMLPIVRVPSVEEGIRQALVSEHGYKHSSMIHSLNVEHMTMMARALDSTIFVKNGSCLAGLGAGGEGYPSFSIATTTGEGITTPMTFTRRRRCVLVDQLKIY
jgi:aldehyde dehydrogenase